MIQRVQSLLMLISALLTGSLLKLKLADLISGNQLYVFRSGGIFQESNRIQDGLPLLIFIGIILLLHLLAIFSYKNRIRQMRFLVFTIILMVGLTGLYFYFAYASFDNIRIAYKLPFVFPIVASILDYMAIRAIAKDEALVRSVDRIRSKK